MKLQSHKVWSRKEDHPPKKIFFHLIILQTRKLRGREEIWLITGMWHTVLVVGRVPGGLIYPTEWFFPPSLTGSLFTQEYLEASLLANINTSHTASVVYSGVLLIHPIPLCSRLLFSPGINQTFQDAWLDFCLCLRKSTESSHPFH